MGGTETRESGQSYLKSYPLEQFLLRNSIIARSISSEKP
jgi:hypothetical protein